MAKCVAYKWDLDLISSYLQVNQVVVTIPWLWTGANQKNNGPWRWHLFPWKSSNLCQVSDLPISKLGRISRPVVTFEGVSYTKVVDNSKWNDTEGHGWQASWFNKAGLGPAFPDKPSSITRGIVAFLIYSGSATLWQLHRHITHDYLKHHCHKIALIPIILHIGGSRGGARPARAPPFAWHPSFWWYFGTYCIK